MKTTTNTDLATTTAQIRRELRYATREDGARITIDVAKSTRGNRVTSGYTVTWNVRSTGWHKGWKVSKFATEAQAVAFADAKWTVLLAWLDRLPEQNATGGAAAAFSAQVATVAA